MGSSYKSDFIIAYDISCEKRLRKVAKILEKESLRIQKSVYLCKEITKDELYRLVDKALKILDINSDDLRIYKIGKGSINLHSAMDIDYPDVF